jgi:hypothetical protein
MIFGHWDKCDICEEEIEGIPHVNKKVLFWKKSLLCDECHKAVREWNKIGRQASIFWDNYNNTHNNLPHICDFSLDELRRRHANVLKLVSEYSARDVGLLIAGECYENVWGSRSCSGTLARLMEIDVGDEDAYLWYYCSGSSYFDLVYYGDPLIEAFIKANDLDKMG